MKKIFTLLFLLIFSLTLASCKDKEKDSPKKSFLDNENMSYYLSTYAQDWTVSENTKLNKVDLTSSTEDINPKVLEMTSDKLSNIKELYLGNLIVNNYSEHTTKYNGKEINSNLLFSVVITDDISDDSTYFKVPSSSNGASYINLTPDYLYDINQDNPYSGAAVKPTTNAMSEFSGILVVVRFKNEVNGAQFALGFAEGDINSDVPTNPDDFQTPEGHEHNPSYQYSYDENAHWYQCKCGKKVDYETHKFDNGLILTPATCTTEGKIKYSCKCGYSYEDTLEINPEAHNPSTTYIYDEEAHWYSCPCGEKLESGEHKYDNGHITLKPTTTETGIKQYTCYCGHYYEDIVPVLKPGEEDPDDVFDSGNGEDILPDGKDLLRDNVQEGLILHAWNWSYKNIEASLADIAMAGYSSIQVSPVQQPKDYNPTYPKGWAEQWWKFYQPVSYAIAEQSWLGTKDDLISLCNTAEKYGIKIIVDIVANHSGSLTEGKLDYPNKLSAEVKTYEPDLYNNSSSYIRGNATSTSDGSIMSVVQGHLGMPELRTDTKFVQDMIIDLLKECIDCGVDGFRFDAAKHIETPDDGQYASDFWPNVIGAATTYAQSKNNTLYLYGEILNTPGPGRSWTSYTKYMNITDNKTGNNIRSAVVSGNAGSAASSTYLTGQPANQVVLWAESHDTYANDEQESTNISQENINKTWALVAARKDATALYFARPGEIGTIGTYAWKSVEVSAVNRFHNLFVGANEVLYSSGNYAIVERYDNNKQGIVIVNCKGYDSDINISIKNLKDGKYVDMISGNEFNVSNGKLTGKMGKTGIVVLSSVSSATAPVITLSQEGGFYSNNLELKVELAFATNARVKIGNQVSYITESTTFNINNVANGGKINVEVSAVNDNYRITKSYEFIRLDGVDANTIVVTNVPSKYLTGYDIYAWVWPSGKDGREIKAEIAGEYVMFKVNDNDGNFLLVANTKGLAFDWTLNAKHQTSDYLIQPNVIYSADESKWKSK